LTVKYFKGFTILMNKFDNLSVNFSTIGHQFESRISRTQRREISFTSIEIIVGVFERKYSTSLTFLFFNIVFLFWLSDYVLWTRVTSGWTEIIIFLVLLQYFVCRSFHVSQFCICAINQFHISRIYRKYSE